MNPSSKIYIAGHRGMVGSAIKRNLEVKGYTNIITRTHSELDLTNQQAVNKFFETERPEYVFLAAAKVRRHTGKQHVPCRVHLRKPYD